MVPWCVAEPDVREQPAAAGADAHHDAADARTATEPGDAADDDQPTGISFNYALTYCFVVLNDSIGYVLCNGYSISLKRQWTCCTAKSKNEKSTATFRPPVDGSVLSVLDPKEPFIKYTLHSERSKPLGP